MKNQKHFVISQIKNIGDVVLCLPIAAQLKKSIPNCRITLLAQAYTFPIAQHCPDIDEMMDWPKIEQKGDIEIIETFKRLNATAIIHLANNKKIAKYAFKAGIKLRVGTSQRLYHWIYCNLRINQARRHSSMHELQLNIKMLKPLKIIDLEENQSKQALIELIHLQVPRCRLPNNLESQFNPNYKKIILHPGSNGHGREWPIEHFAKLASELNKSGFQVIFTGTKSEAIRFRTLINQCPFVINTFGLLTIEELMVLIDKSDLFIGAGTGPTHIAAALNKPTIALFPPRRGISPRRWSPPGNNVTTLMYKRKKPCFACRESEGCWCMKQITVNQVMAEISKIF